MIKGVDDQNNVDIPMNNNNTQGQDLENMHDDTQLIPEEEENEPHKYVTIGDINIMLEINASNKEADSTEYEEIEIRTTEQYNL